LRQLCRLYRQRIYKMFRLFYSLTLFIKLVAGVLRVQISNIAQIRTRLIAAECNNVPTFVDTQKIRLNSSSWFSSLFYLSVKLKLKEEEREREREKYVYYRYVSFIKFDARFLVMRAINSSAFRKTKICHKKNISSYRNYPYLYYLLFHIESSLSIYSPLTFCVIHLMHLIMCYVYSRCYSYIYLWSLLTDHVAISVQC